MNAEADEVHMIAWIIAAAVLLASVSMFWRMVRFWHAWRWVTRQVRLDHASQKRERRGLFVRRVPVDLAGLIRGVAASLQAGASLEQAWAESLPAGRARDRPGAESLWSERPNRVLRGRSNEGPEHAVFSAYAAQQVTADGVPLWLERLALRPTWKLWWQQRWRKTLDSARTSKISQVKALDLSHARASNWPQVNERLTLRDVIGRHRPELAALRLAANNVRVACRFTQASGAPLADILLDVADGMDQQVEVDRARKVARAGPTMSARVLAFLPLLGVGLAAFMGAKPFELFANGGVGTACLVVGSLFEVTGVLVTWWMIRSATKLPEGPDVALWCDLSRMGVASGASIPDVLGRLGQAGEEPALEHFSRCLRLGVPWDQAWEQCLSVEQAEMLVPLGRPLQSAWDWGLSPEVLLASAAESIRQSLMAQARESAEVLAVRLVIPVASCLLPAFVFLGVVPLLVRFLGASIAGLT